MNKKDIYTMLLTIAIITVAFGSILYEISEWRECIGFNSMSFCLKALVQ
jgi:hypothetical protein